MPNKNTGYSNFFLSNEVEDQFESHLNLQQFCTVDRSLQGTAGMTRKINVYSATNGTEKNATEGEIIIGTKQAVTLFIKKNTEIERIAKNMRSETAANVRLNTVFSRKYYLPALTDATKAVKIVLA